MAVIEKIRQRSGLLIIFVGFALVLFLVSDAISNNLGLFNKQDTTIGEIDGKRIDYVEFNSRFEQYKSNMEAQGQVMDEYNSNMLREQVWNEYIQNIVVDKQYEALGLQVSSDEMFAAVTNPVDLQQLRDAPAFKNEATGQFDPQKLIQYLKQIDQDPSGQGKKGWVEFEEKSVKPILISKKYNILISKAVYRTKLEVQAEYTDNNTQVDGRVVGFNFNSILDDSVSVTDEEMQEYLDKNAAKYQQEASRRIEYVVFDIVPSAEDTLKVAEWAADKAERFHHAKNDTLFIQTYNDNGFDSTFKTRGTYVDHIDDSIFNSPEGTILGPFKDGAEYAVYKVLKTMEDTLPYIRARHILIKPRGAGDKADTLKAQEKANSILRALREGADFEKMANDSSMDYRTAAKGGDLGWMRRNGGSLPAVVEDILYTKSVGDLFVVRSAMGVHVVKVTGPKTFKKVAVGKVWRSIEYSNKTDGAVYDQATQFIAASDNGKAFSDASDKMGLIKRISPDLHEGEANLPNIEEAREVIRWAFNEKTELGDISGVIPSGNKYIVATLVNIKEKGTAKLEDIRDQLQADTRKAKKAEMLKEKIRKAMGEGKTLDQIALDLGAIVSTVPNVSFNNTNLPFVGNDPKLCGAMLGAPLNKITGPIDTENGVYIFEITARRDPAEMQNLAAERSRMIQEASGQVSNRAFEALKKAANIQDFRYRFY